MSEELIVRHCSPTLAGLKTGNLFSCPYNTKDELTDYVRRLNQRLHSKGLRVLPVRLSNQRALIYLYRPERLKRDFSVEAARGLLLERGYPCDHPSQCVIRLIQRLREGEEFPHEIGLFLGYPPEDVQGFIDNKSDCKYTGCWKVYGDDRAAQALFAKYKKCTDVYCAQWAKGKSIERLTVAELQ